MYQKWPDQIFPIVNFVFSHYGHFGLGRGGGGFGGAPPPPLVFNYSKEALGAGGPGGSLCRPRTASLPSSGGGPRARGRGAPAGPQQGPVELVRGHVGARQDDDVALALLEAVHLHEQRVQRVLPLVVAAGVDAVAAGPRDGVDLVDVDDAALVLPRLLEQRPDAPRPHPHEHLHEVGPADAEEGHLALAGHGLGEQRLAGPRGAHEDGAVGDLGPQAREALGVLRRARVRDVVEERGGGGVWDPKVCVPKMADQIFPMGNFVFFPRWSLWSAGGGRVVQGGGAPPLLLWCTAVLIHHSPPPHQQRRDANRPSRLLPLMLSVTVFFLWTDSRSSYAQTAQGRRKDSPVPGTEDKRDETRPGLC